MKNNFSKKFIKNSITSIFDPNNYYNNSIFDLKIDLSNIQQAGLGVFALENIPKNCFIAYYEGKIINNNPINSEYYFEINEQNGIDAADFPRCYMAMINDARGSIETNNCKFVIDYKNFLVEIWAIKNINAGEELFISYGSSYWEW